MSLIGNSRSIALSVLLMASGMLKAGDHLVIQRWRTFMGTPSPKRETEVWLGDQKAASKSGNLLTIYRFDLRKLWTISAEKNQYSEEPLKLPEESIVDTRVVDLHKIGFGYEPQYDWVVRKTGQERTINGVKCRLMIAAGEDDYASDTVEIWVAESVPIRTDQYDTLVSYTNGGKWRNIYAASPELHHSVIMKWTDREDPPVGAAMVSDKEVTVIEVLEVPEGKFELPVGCKRVNTSDDVLR